MSKDRPMLSGFPGEIQVLKGSLAQVIYLRIFDFKKDVGIQNLEFRSVIQIKAFDQTMKNS